MAPARRPHVPKSRSSSTSSIESRAPGRAFDSTPQSKTREPLLSPTTSPDEPVHTKRPPIRRKVAGLVGRSRYLESDDGATESSGDEVMHSPTRTPDSRRRSGSHVGQQSAGATALTASSSRRSSRSAPSRLDKRRLSSSGRAKLQSVSGDEGRSASDDETLRWQPVPGAYQSFSTQSQSLASRFAPNPGTISGLDGNIVLIEFLPLKLSRKGKRRSVPQIEIDNDSRERSTTPNGQIRPDFQPFQVKGCPRPSKERRSINLEILKCLATASKKKKKAKPSATLGCIYVFESPEHAPFHLKVGKSSRDPMKRKSEWESSCGITLVEVEDTDRNFFEYYDIVESLLQTELQNFRRMYKCTACNRQHGEWFQADKRVVLEVINRWRRVLSDRMDDTHWSIDFFAQLAVIAQGIGAGIARDLAQRGANVVVNYASARGEVAAAELAKEIESRGSKVAVVQANVAIFADLKKIIDAALAVSEHGKIDIFVHNAATGDDCFLEDMTEEFYQAQMDMASIFLTQLALPYFGRGGRIVLISSVSARMGMPQQTVYAGSKAALEGICKVWATELGRKYEITVNCVSPGPIATDMWQECEPEVIADFQPMINATPAAARVGEVSDIVPIVAFLGSEESRWVTGSVVSASGGMSFI
ncbi:hypothetical protein VTL71DRAFT_576 [Oculimacula yallundae]|uniref:Uncharacterized protein n=1 Tax=Oculimacula yallundae TaxID=86028 RepID=A0ABR4D0E7_9HELO